LPICNQQEGSKTSLVNKQPTTAMKMATTTRIIQNQRHKLYKPLKNDNTMTTRRASMKAIATIKATVATTKKTMATATRASDNIKLRQQRHLRATTRKTTTATQTMTAITTSVTTTAEEKAMALTSIDSSKTTMIKTTSMETATKMTINTTTATAQQQQNNYNNESRTTTRQTQQQQQDNN
jgi:hypothetical protein